MKPRVLQLFAAGVNCDRELKHAFELAGAEVSNVHIRALAQDSSPLKECDMFAIPGGFTYGDDLGAGRILALELEKFLGPALQEHREAGGSIFGVCNGFQVLVKAGLLPGLEGVKASLTWNQSHRFECRWTRLLPAPSLDGLVPGANVLPAPSAHAEGRLVLGEPEADLSLLEEAGCIALRYADERGEPTAEYPDCPNGSTGGIAGLLSPCGRILGLMPHPERNLSAEHLPDRGAGEWGRGGEGVDFFRGLLAPYLAGTPA